MNNLSSLPVRNTDYKDSDDYNPDGKSISINEIVNGYVVYYTNDENEWSEPYRYPRDNQQMLEDIKKFLGL